MMVKEAEARLAALLDRVNAAPIREPAAPKHELHGCVQLIGSNNHVIIHMHCVHPSGQPPAMPEASNDS